MKLKSRKKSNERDTETKIAGGEPCLDSYHIKKKIHPYFIYALAHKVKCFFYIPTGTDICTHASLQQPASYLSFTGRRNISSIV